ncbi:metal ABC transporter ATP-binding protein [Yersinia enterocolitica]|uniref:metal ABC transporter ATP-binding protein n=1 Tax=Yersinia enterocolitica TaxID=630 RepID=UPI0002DADA2E|nr:ABC transporter ATP-binding protein [Yersinia enterocolitica]HDL7098045.1 ABC transporter ATP-binding protein [Yersinia enterocolitica]HDL7342161.1 ABC transporter ATP-binding protein [Yersinia enterocolitica]HDL7465905.1 ABC transporter ATP-binding protein [Yersinia enterocolitica]HDL7917726.1 ABC transporter ATP-binding protein [Yersinia enterocolitica]HDL8241654.1 ABC transporter ATP-binding protein [Yersinia enterocolitica]
MINLKNTEIGYDNHALTPPIDGCFVAGSLTAIIGANGAGKSTLLKTLAGLQPAVAGQITFTGGRVPQMAYLPQQAELDRQFPIVVQDVVAMGCWPQSGLLGGINHQSRQRINQALSAVGMQDMARQPVGELSGGQLQRVLFARLLVQQAQLILLDEPFTGIDSQTVGLLLEVIHQLHTEGRTIIAVLHDMSMVEEHFPHALWLTPQGHCWQSAEQVLVQWHHSHGSSCSFSSRPSTLRAINL